MTRYIKSCVFCGNVPTDKNKEHIIPRWLIKLTGKDARQIIANFDKTNRKPRKFSFKAFTFPACESCNTKYSALEADVKDILIKVMNKCVISIVEIDLLMDWFDKVRIGLWLGQYHLDRNYGGIEPRFYISSRIGKKDRVLGISYIDNLPDGINWIGTETLLFLRSPSCFGLRINNWIFLNLSFEFLVSKNLGFPYPINYFFLDGRRSEADIEFGHEMITIPVLPFKVNLIMSWIFQPILDKQLVDTEYHTEYVKKYSLLEDKEKGKPVIQIGNMIARHAEVYTLYPRVAPSNNLEQLCIAILKAQIEIQNISPSCKILGSDIQNRYNEMTKKAVEFNKNQIKLIEKYGLPENV